jgi:hypothetical protein
MSWSRTMLRRGGGWVTWIFFRWSKLECAVLPVPLEVDVGVCGPYRYRVASRISIACSAATPRTSKVGGSVLVPCIVAHEFFY